MNTKIILLISAICFNCSLYGQISKAEYLYLKNKIPVEKIEIHTNTNLLVVGEFLHFQISNFNTGTKTYSSISKITYVELIGDNHNVILKQKLKSESGLSFGDFFLSSNIKTGHYKLIAYTNWSKNNDSNRFAEKDIYIINPFSSKHQIPRKINSEAVISKITTDHNDFSMNESINPILVSTNKKNYTTREKVTINISENHLAAYNGLFSLSVRKFDSIFIKSDHKNEKKTETSMKTYFLPELRGDIISGRLTSLDNISVSDKLVSLSIPGKKFYFKNTRTNRRGDFHFILNEHFNSSNAFIQVKEKNFKEYDIYLNEEGFNDYNDFKFNSVELNSNIKNWLTTRSINNQIENVYLDSVITNSNYDTNIKPFFNTLEKRFYLDDYNRFPTIKETIVEIVNTASLSQKNGRYEFNIPDYGNIYFNNNLNLKPLVIFDGFYIENLNDIIDFNTNKLESISTVTGLYVYGTEIYNGVISFLSKQGDFKLNSVQDNIQILNLSNLKTYQSPNYNSKIDKRIPDYRTQLFWKPNVNLNNSNNEPYYFEFFTSDEFGVFEVILEGYTNTGKHIKMATYFNVN